MSTFIEGTQQSDKGLGFVLEGGAMRALFSAGAIDVLMENNIFPNGVIGVSAGAAFGCNIKSRQIGRSIRYNKLFAKEWRYCSIRSLVTTGDVFGGEFCYHRIPNTLDVFDIKTFDENPLEFYAVCTDVDTGKPIYKKLTHANDECYEWVRASASMPVAAKIVTINGQRLLDGGIADSIPLKHFQEIGYRKNIVILTQPRNFVKTPGKMNKLVNIMLRKHPRFIEASNNRHVMYNKELDHLREQEALGNALVLAPDEKLPIGHICHDPELMQHVYDLGRQHTEKRLEEIKKFVKK